MEERSNKLPIILKGMAMGVAEVIPGVSGGTIALITGIYSRLISSISSFGPGLWFEFKENGFSAVWQKIDGWFLVYLLVGMMVGAFTSVFGVSYLIEYYPEPLWAFFFGLILASSVYVWNKIDSWTWKHLLLCVLGALLAFSIITISPTSGSTNPLLVFVSGFIAITAFILPGISGSFILLLMGMYSIIIPTIKSFLESPELAELQVLAIFGVGCILGLMLFSRVLTYTFRHYANETYAILTGFMIASLYKIWPWKNPTSVLDKETMEVFNSDILTLLSNKEKVYKVLSEHNVWPHHYEFGEPRTGVVIVCACIGVVLVGLMARWGK